MVECLGSSLVLKRQTRVGPQNANPESEPALCAPHLGVSHIHASGVQSVLYLLCIVDLQEVIATKLDIRQLLVVLKKVDGEGHLAGCAGCCGDRASLPGSTGTWSQHLRSHSGFNTEPVLVRSNL